MYFARKCYKIIVISNLGSFVSQPSTTATGPSPLAIPGYESSRSPVGGYILIALGIIVAIGSLAATGYLYSSLGYPAFAIAGVGALGAIAMAVGGKKCLGSSSSDAHSSSEEASPQPTRTHIGNQAFRAQVFQGTLDACENGYDSGSNRVTINHEPMLRGTQTYEQLPPLEGSGSYTTRFAVEVDDTFNVLVRLAQEDLNPVGINMANRFQPGGGVLRGASAQEEALCRRSNHYLGLETQLYPLPELGGIYCPYVQVFRRDDFSFMPEPVEVSLVAVAAYDLRSKQEYPLPLGLTDTSEVALQASQPYIEGTQGKIRNMLRIMALKGHTTLVLGALGCGAFQNPPAIVAQLFQEIFQESEFRGRFQQVIFAVLKMTPRDQGNVDAFTRICEQLNPPV